MKLEFSTDLAFRGARGMRQGVTLLALALSLGGCSSVAGTWDKLFGKEDAPLEEPADRLYNQGLYLLNQEKKSVAAAKRFEEVDRQHPYSDLARKSLLMSAYAHYESQDYDASIGAAQRYITLHPGDVIWLGCDGACEPDLVEGDIVEIANAAIGVLRNPVEREK